MTPEFRAWDKVKQEYSKNPLFIGKDGSIWDSCVGTYDLSDEVNDEMITEQYTRLKDVNGNKIFEGDIVKVTSEDGGFYVAAVKWFGDEGYPAFDLAGIPAAWCYDSNALATIFESSFETYEVIGNIHENPELLEVEK